MSTPQIDPAAPILAPYEPPKSGILARLPASIVPYAELIRLDKPTGTYWCTSSIQSSSTGVFSVSVGTPFVHVKWFRGRDTPLRRKSACPDPSCCRKPPEELAGRWEEAAWPSARLHSSLLAAMPTGTFTGVDLTEVYEFLEAHAPE